MNFLMGSWSAHRFSRTEDSFNTYVTVDGQSPKLNSNDFNSSNSLSGSEPSEGDDYCLKGYSILFARKNQAKTKIMQSRLLQHIKKDYMNRQFPKKNPSISSITECEYHISKPAAFEEIPQLLNLLRARKAVILNLQYIKPNDAQRCVDFMCGGAFSLDGDQKRISDSVFIFSPSNVTIRVDKLPAALN